MLFSKHVTSLAGVWSSTGCSFLVMLSFTLSTHQDTKVTGETPASQGILEWGAGDMCSMTKVCQANRNYYSPPWQGS